MASIIYKKIAEIKLYHDYFLSKVDSTFFALSDAEKETQLQEVNEFDIANVLNIVPTKICAERMRNHKIRFIKTRFGFFLGQEVERILQAGEVLYKPMLPLDESVGLSFSIQSVDGYFQNYTGIPIRKKIPSIKMYFDNKDDNSDKFFPALSLPVSDFNASLEYEMGEMAINAAQLQQVINLNPTVWQDVDSDGYVNRQDNQLLADRFFLQFDPATVPVSITATLSDSGGLVKSIDQITEGATNVLINFCKNPVDDCIATGWYTLDIEDENNINIFSRKVFINNELFNQAGLGIIELFSTNSTNYNLIDANGFIIHRIDALGVKLSHPIFEIRMRSRSSFWRYKSKTAFEIAEKNAATAAAMTISVDEKLITTSTPEYLVAGINRPINGISVPNPSPADMRYETDKKIYSDIQISTIRRFQT